MEIRGKPRIGFVGVGKARNRAGRVETLYDPGGEAPPRTVRPILPPVHAMRAQAMAFVQAIQGEAPPCDATEALADLRVAREYLRLWKSV